MGPIVWEMVPPGTIIVELIIEDNLQKIARFLSVQLSTSLKLAGLLGTSSENGSSSSKSRAADCGWILHLISSCALASQVSE